MRGELLNVWEKVWSELFVKLSKHKDAPKEIFSELYQAMIPRPLAPAEPDEATQFGPDGKLTDPDEIAAEEAYKIALEAFNEARSLYEEVITGSRNARLWLRTELLTHITSEPKAISALEAAFEKVRDIGTEDFANRYFTLVEGFIEKFSLRYDLRRPFSLHPTLPGIFARLMRSLEQAALTDADLSAALHEFKEALRDLTTDQSAHRIKTCIAKQTNFLELVGQRAPHVNRKTLGAICGQVGTWPHDQVRDAVKDLYTFASDYPGIRHGGTVANRRREIEMRDLVAVCVAFFGFSPYLTDLFDANDVYLIGEDA